MYTASEIEIQKEQIEKVKKMNQNIDLKYHILTMGCQLNENDSEKLCGMLEEMGYKKTRKCKGSRYCFIQYLLCERKCRR